LTLERGLDEGTSFPTVQFLCRTGAR
jgi:hypothetical protein